MQKKPSALIAILIVISLIAVSGLSIYHDEVRSDLLVDFPTSIRDIDHSGSVYTIDSELNYATMLDSSYTIHLIEDSKKYCTLNATFTYSSNHPTVSIRYEFWTEKNSFVPQGSECIRQGENSSAYRYLDELTGNELTFNISDNLIHSVDFQGKTMIRSEGDLKSVDFNLHVVYAQNSRFIQNYVMYDLPDSISFDLQGVENGFEKTGTILFEPIVSKALYRSDGSIYYTANISHVVIDIDDTLLSGNLLDFYIVSHDGFSYEYLADTNWDFLTAENIFIEMDVQNSWKSLKGERIFNFSGTINTTAFSEEGTLTETLKFQYEVV